MRVGAGVGRGGMITRLRVPGVGDLLLGGTRPGLEEGGMEDTVEVRGRGVGVRMGTEEVLCVEAMGVAMEGITTMGPSEGRGTGMDLEEVGLAGTMTGEEGTDLGTARTHTTAITPTTTTVVVDTLGLGVDLPVLDLVDRTTGLVVVVRTSEDLLVVVRPADRGLTRVPPRLDREDEEVDPDRVRLPTLPGLGPGPEPGPGREASRGPGRGRTPDPSPDRGPLCRGRAGRSPAVSAGAGAPSGGRGGAVRVGARAGVGARHLPRSSVPVYLLSFTARRGRRKRSHIKLKRNTSTLSGFPDHITLRLSHLRESKKIA